MKKLFVTIIAGVCLLGFASCEQDQVIPNGSGDIGKTSKVGPQAIIDVDDDSIDGPAPQPLASFAFDIEEKIQKIEK